ncbi:TetR/AcrR family transcriptional regulator [Frankia sp. Cj3]|uniref:TetR/AcrR family transcriptional regulator n=1 Tax=Frankia sp. Cj3 TaxID=2880976 RepID=UPI001EF50B08|nr:TetR/AcrR family transcriptional regulator [Frankia sp. Cj3]
MDSDKQAAERLQKLNRYLEEKNRRLNALIQLCAQHPVWPIEAMVREYSAALDVTDERLWTEQGHGTNADGLGPRQRSGRTRRTRTRDNLILIATRLVVQRRPFLLKDLANPPEVARPTVYLHFRTKEELLCAVYDRLIQPILNQATKEN